jgi:Ca2+/Na+ antiporter
MAMFFALGKLLLVLLVVLTVVYVSLSLWSRAVRREQLERRWDEEGRSGDREAYVEAGLEEYDGSVRRKLLLGVYVVPLAVVAAIVYLVNYA